MDTFPSLEALGFPARRSHHYADWAPIYLELMVGSGERICIGVVAADANDVIVSKVSGVERLACVYGEQIDGLVFASELAIRATRVKVAQDGIHSLPTWMGVMDGLVIGPIRKGAGTSLDDVAQSGLLQSASLHFSPEQQIRDVEEDVPSSFDSSCARLENLIRDTVVAARPDLLPAFGRVIRTSEHARPTKIGFVGRRLAANFSILIPGRVKSHVDLAKAKLWDLTQLRVGLNADLFNFSSDLEYELLLYRTHPEDPAYNNRQLMAIKAAVLELEEEADKASIRCRPLDSPSKIADVVLSKEAA